MKFLKIESNYDSNDFILIQINEVVISNILLKYDLSRKCSIIEAESDYNAYDAVRNLNYNTLMAFNDLNTFVSIALLFKNVIKN